MLSLFIFFGFGKRPRTSTKSKNYTSTKQTTSTKLSSTGWGGWVGGGGWRQWWFSIKTRIESSFIWNRACTVRTFSKQDCERCHAEPQEQVIPHLQPPPPHDHAKCASARRTTCGRARRWDNAFSDPFAFPCKMGQYRKGRRRQGVFEYIYSNLGWGVKWLWLWFQRSLDILAMATDLLVQYNFFLS